jgi:uncharacterized protein (DUF2147 family)
MQNSAKLSVLSATKGLLLSALLAASSLAFAGNDSPVGVWKTIDDNTGQPKGLVQITEAGGVLTGKVIKSFKPLEGDKQFCTACKDERKGQPIIGLTILTGLKKNGDKYEGGNILDPENGNVYDCKMTMLEDGKKLNVRGFLGISLLGRTQTWVREE